jgi:hypothetical protein
LINIFGQPNIIPRLVALMKGVPPSPIDRFGLYS